MKEKQEVVLEQVREALKVGREAKTTGAIKMVINLSQGGIQDARLMVERRVV